MHLLKSRVPKLWLTARRNRQEIVTAGLNRRELFKMGLLTSGGYLVAKSGLSAWASGGCEAGECQLGCSPPTTPFIDPLRIPPILPSRPVTDLRPAPQECPNNAINPATGLPFEPRAVQRRPQAGNGLLPVLQAVPAGRFLHQSDEGE